MIRYKLYKLKCPETHTHMMNWYIIDQSYTIFPNSVDVFYNCNDKLSDLREPRIRSSIEGIYSLSTYKDDYEVVLEFSELSEIVENFPEEFI